MAGLYIHIPFCKTRCAYCDFYSITCIADKSALIEAICREMQLRRNYLQVHPNSLSRKTVDSTSVFSPEKESARTDIRTIYFGGGTPSLLVEEDFEKIFTHIKHLTDFSGKKEPFVRIPLPSFLKQPAWAEEITIEANPDDLSEKYLAMLRQFPFNRISIGIQSFNDDELRFLNRRHNAEQAIKAVERCRRAGFNNISIDLMYGLPLQTLESWQDTLQTAIALNVEHISAYHLTYEPQTVLGKMLTAGTITPASEETGLAQFSFLIDILKSNGFEHYEISNFAKKNYRSKHNSAYWQGQAYLGIGPSAHSYDGDSRQWNTADTKQYIQSLVTCATNKTHVQAICPAGSELEKNIFFEREELTPTDKYNDYVITRLRTVEGIDLTEINRQFGKNLADYCLKKAQPFVLSGKLKQTSSHLKTTVSGIFISDYIMEQLMWA